MEVAGLSLADSLAIGNRIATHKAINFVLSIENAPAWNRWNRSE